MTYLLVVRDAFHKKPSGRLPIHDPEANGELFRKTVLVPTLAKHSHVTVDFTGIALVGASFLDEAIAGLVFHEGFTETQLRQRLDILIPSDPTKVATAWEWVSRAEQSMRPKSTPKVMLSASHATA